MVAPSRKQDYLLRTPRLGERVLRSCGTLNPAQEGERQGSEGFEGAVLRYQAETQRAYLKSASYLKSLTRSHHRSIPSASAPGSGTSERLEA